MQFAKAHDGTITVTMSPDEASITAMAMSRSLNDSTMGETLRGRVYDLSEIIADSCTAKPTNAHLLFNQLHLHLRGLMIEGEIDELHHEYTDLIALHPAS